MRYVMQYPEKHISSYEFYFQVLINSHSELPNDFDALYLSNFDTMTTT